MDLDRLNYNKIYWKTRRGVLELDVILNTFWRDNNKKLSLEQQLNFAKLLDYSDPELLDFLVYRNSLPTIPAMQQVIAIVLIFTSEKNN